jgi:cytochrome P450/NADPH-cytochrome P450 reductase
LKRIFLGVKGDQVIFFLEGLHRNSDYWGTDVDTFDPDRFLPEAVEKRHPDAYHPFGAGIRSCIGFRFSLKEATMVLTRLYQRYRFSLKDKNYQLKHVETLTVKPKDLYVLIEKRPAGL